MEQATIERRRRGRPAGSSTGPRYEQTTAGFPPGVMAALDEEAGRAGKSRSEVIREAVEDHLRRLAKRRTRGDGRGEGE